LSRRSGSPKPGWNTAMSIANPQQSAAWRWGKKRVVSEVDVPGIGLHGKHEIPSLCDSSAQLVPPTIHPCERYATWRATVCPGASVACPARLSRVPQPDRSPSFGAHRRRLSAPEISSGNLPSALPRCRCGRYSLRRNPPRTCCTIAVLSAGACAETITRMRLAFTGRNVWRCTVRL